MKRSRHNDTLPKIAARQTWRHETTTLPNRLLESTMLDLPFVPQSAVLPVDHVAAGNALPVIDVTDNYPPPPPK